jgi:hypothetical protein
MYQRPGRKGAGRTSARALARRVHDKNPRKIGCLRRHHRFRPDGRRGLRCASFRNSARHRAGHSAARRHLRQRLRQQSQPRGGKKTRGIAPVIPHKANDKNKPAFFAILYKACSRIEQGFGWLKRLKRVALRCKKTHETSGRSCLSPLASA